MSTGLITLACLLAVGHFLPIALPSPAQIVDTPWRSPLARVGIRQQPTILIFSRPASLSLLAVWLLGKARPSLFVTHFLYMDIRMREAGAKAASGYVLLGLRVLVQLCSQRHRPKVGSRRTAALQLGRWGGQQVLRKCPEIHLTLCDAHQPRDSQVPSVRLPPAR